MPSSSKTPVYTIENLYSQPIHIGPYYEDPKDLKKPEYERTSERFECTIGSNDDRGLEEYSAEVPSPSQEIPLWAWEQARENEAIRALVQSAHIRVYRGRSADDMLGDL